MRFNSILVVCVGNICRSPTGAALLESKLPHIRIASAGVATEKSGLQGKPADMLAQQVALDFGLDLSNHRAQQLDQNLAQQFDLILVMEPEHINLVAEICPEARHKTLLFGQWGEGSIIDPFSQRREFFEKTYNLISKASCSWANRLS
ncbi:arsenate reductase/protein-tyrosine-phosphatase family protein [Vibrio sinaloensis]|uniref:arsenate reductase/protein-tyrosine-phosphatase family protein n=1 Tax=Photobacterium sp. (strain ATCC 43367) TaxID=379097 RepID=UPI0035EDD89A